MWLRLRIPLSCESAILMWILIDLFYAAVFFAALPVLLVKMWQRKGYARVLQNRLRCAPPRPGDRPCLWIHAVSVGEVKLAAGLIKEIRRQLPGHEVAVSSTTVQGMEIARKTFDGSTVFHSPLDFSWVVSGDFRNLRPSCLVLVELELWPNLLIQARRFGVPVVVVNCRITERSCRGYRLLDAVFSGFIPSLGVRMFCAQNETYARRLTALGVPGDRVCVTGSMKYDDLRTAADPARQRALRDLFGLKPEDLVLVAASTHDDEEEQIAGIFPAIAREFPGARLIIAPRHVERAPAVLKAVSGAGLRAVRKTELREPLSGVWKTAVILDTMGELVDVMSLASVVFVGKSLSAENRGGHNVLEPAALGKPVVFGPHMANFESEAQFLLANEAARRVRGRNGLRDVCVELFRSPALCREMGEKAAGLIARNQGATRSNVAVLREILAGQP